MMEAEKCKLGSDNINMVKSKKIPKSQFKKPNLKNPNPI